MNAKLLIHTKDPFVLLLFYFSCYHIRNLFNEKSSSKIKNTIPQHRKLRFNHFEVSWEKNQKFDVIDGWKVTSILRMSRFRKPNKISEMETKLRLLINKKIF